MESSPEDISNFQTLGQVFDWCGIDGLEEDTSSVRGSLLEILGAKDDSSPALLGALDARFFQEITSKWKIRNSQPSALQWGQLSTVGSVCRLIASSQVGVPPKRPISGNESDAAGAALVASEASPPKKPGARKKGGFSQRLGSLGGLPSSRDPFPDEAAQLEEVPRADFTEREHQKDQPALKESELSPSDDPLPEVWDWFEVVFSFVFVKCRPAKSAQGLGGMALGQKFQVKRGLFRDEDLDVWVELTPFELWRSCKCKSLKHRGFVMLDATKLGKGQLIRGPLPPGLHPGPDRAEEAGLSWRLFHGIPPPSPTLEEDSYICRWKAQSLSEQGSEDGLAPWLDADKQRCRGSENSDMKYTKLCIGTLLRGAPPQCVCSWILYHHRIGFDRLIMFFDDPDDPAIAVAEEFALRKGSPDHLFGGYPHTVVHRLTEEWWEKAKSRSRFYASQHEQWAKSVIQAHEEAGEVTARQQLCLDLAAMDARSAGYEWILHIDIDELFYIPDEYYRLNAKAWFNRVSPMVEMIRFHNHECVPEKWEVNDWFQEVTLFKVNPEFLKPRTIVRGSRRDLSPQARVSHDDEKENNKNAAGQHSSNDNKIPEVESEEEEITEGTPGARVCEWVFRRMLEDIRRVRWGKTQGLNLCLPDVAQFEKLEKKQRSNPKVAPGRPPLRPFQAPKRMTEETFTYFLAYSDGKAAARLQPRAPMPSFVTHFRGHDGKRLLPRQRADGDADPVILHYANCGFSYWKRKYEMLGDFPDAVDGHLIAMRAHLACRDLTQRGDPQSLQDFYKLFVMGNEYGELPAMVSRGLALRVYGAQEIVDVARIAYESRKAAGGEDKE